MGSFNDLLWVRRALCAFAILSLSTMAGMSIGAGILMAASLLSWGIAWRLGQHKEANSILTHPLALATVALFLASFLSLAAAWAFPPLGIPVRGFSELKKFHHFLYPFVVAYAFHFTADSVERHPYWKIWGGMGIFCALLAAAQFFGADLFPEPWLQHRFFRAVGQTGRYHGQGIMFFHLSFASCLSFVFAAGLARVLWPLRWDQRKDQFFWGLVAAAGFLAVYFSFSRIALAALAAIGILLAFLRKPIWGIGAAVIFLGLGAGLWFQSPSLRDRFTQNMGGVSERTALWQSAWEMLQDRPLTGFGFGRTGQYTPIYVKKIKGPGDNFTSHAHNNLLDALAATGLIGFLAYLFWWLVLFVSAAKSFRFAAPADRWLPAAALAGLLAFQVNGLTQVNFFDGKSQHTLMIWAGVVLALAIRRQKKSRLVFRG